MRRALPVPKTFVVTGASSGIGLACVRRLAARGSWVYGGVRAIGDAESFLAHEVRPLTFDVTKPDEIAAAAESVGPRLDGVVANAGIAVAAPLEFVPLDELRRQLEVNLVGQVATVQAFLPALRGGRGRIVLVGSIGGRSALPFIGPYAASKHALEAIADSWRVELRPFGVAVSIVEPGSIDTAIWQKGAAHAKEIRKSFPQEAQELYGAAVAHFRQVALARGPGANPEIVANAVEHALTSARPRARYVVGRDAHVRSWLERLPTRLRDRLLARVLTGG